jgi:hypothetical protein
VFTGVMYAAWRRYEQAEPLLVDAVARWERAGGLSEPAGQSAVRDLVAMYQTMGAAEKARRWQQRLR